MEREELERLIAKKIENGEMEPGLYDTGLWIVRVYRDGENEDVICFEWYDYPRQLTDFIDL